MTDAELQKVAEIVFEIVGNDCDICPYSFLLGDMQGCMREYGETDCFSIIKRNIKLDIEVKNK
jgi:hypothetical protein